MGRAQLVTAIRVTPHVMATALVQFSTWPDIAEGVLEQLSIANTAVDRLQAEDIARRIALSGILCVELGLSGEQDWTLFHTPGWQELLSKMLYTYDTTDLPEEPR